MRGGLDLCSPSTALKVNCLVIRHLYFRSVRGDLQEGHGCASRCQFLLFLCRSPFFQSTKSGFLCFLELRNPHFRAFRAQNRGFCAFLASETLIFGRFEHKIDVFVRFCPPKPSFSSFSSTKSAFLCSGGGKGASGSVTTETLSQVSSRWWFLRAYCHRDYLLYLTSTRSPSLSPG